MSCASEIRDVALEVGASVGVADELAQMLGDGPRPKPARPSPTAQTCTSEGLVVGRTLRCHRQPGHRGDAATVFDFHGAHLDGVLIVWTDDQEGTSITAGPRRPTRSRNRRKPRLFDSREGTMSTVDRSAIEPGADRSVPDRYAPWNTQAGACGTRARYVRGCRCEVCRTANRQYERERTRARRQGDWNGLVDASRAREHLVALRQAGIGRRLVADIAGVPASTVVKVRDGVKRQIRARTERALLAVTDEALTDARLVSSTTAWKQLDELVGRYGLTKAEVARRLGHRRPALQYQRGRPMTARTVFRIARLHREVAGWAKRTDPSEAP